MLEKKLCISYSFFFSFFFFFADTRYDYITFRWKNGRAEREKSMDVQREKKV